MTRFKGSWRTLLFHRLRTMAYEEFFMNHRHLILAYLVTWLLQLGYFITILVGWRRMRG